MLLAIKQQEDAKLGNTRVEVIDFDGLDRRVNVYLHGKCICQLTDDELEVNHHGFMTVTTKSRINAVLREFNGCTEIIQVQGRWFWQTLSKVVIEQAVAVALLGFIKNDAPCRAICYLACSGVW